MGRGKAKTRERRDETPQKKKAGNNQTQDSFARTRRRKRMLNVRDITGSS